MGFKDEVEEKLALASRVLGKGWIVKVAIGLLIGYLDPITPQQACDYITANKNLLDNLSEEEWEHYRKMAEGADLSEINTDRVILKLKKRRLDLLQIITNTFGGLEWLDRQVIRLRENLGLLTE